MRRREVVAELAISAVASPLAVLAQQSPERVRRIAVLMDLAADDPEAGARLEVLRAELSRLGWTDGRNAVIDIRGGPGIASRMRQFADELVALAPDALFASGSPSVGALQQSSTTLPIVFATVADPVGAGSISI